uniref:Uncharacterized protein n=1 Tax=Chenopodium quinoa TaxID=63459 RepID=A0A803MNI2_CHEQI
MVVVQSAELAKEVLLTQDKNFCNRPETTGRKRLSYNGLDIALSPYSNYLKEIKKVLIFNLLNTKNVGSFALNRQEEVSRYDDEEVLGSRYYRLLHEAEYMFTAFFYSDYFYLGGCIDKITGKHSKLEKTFKELDAIYEKIIDDHLHTLKTESERQDIVDVLLRLMEDTSFPFKLTMNHIKAILLKEDIDSNVLPGLVTHKKNRLCLVARKFDSNLHEEN